MSVESLQITVPQQDSIIRQQDSIPGIQQNTLFDVFSSDSLLQDTLPAAVPSILKQSNVRTQQLKPGDLPGGNIDWITIHLVIALVFLGWVRFVGGRRLRQVIQSFATQRAMNIMMREGNIFSERIAVGLFLVHLVVFSLIGYLSLVWFIPSEQIPLSGFKLFAMVSLIVLVIRLFKNFVLTLTGIIFRNQLVLSAYIPMNFIFNSSLGLILLPFVIVAVYLPSKTVLFIGIGIWLITFVYRIFRQLIISPEYRKFSYLNRILYLCTFEIAPMLVLTRLILRELT